MSVVREGAPCRGLIGIIFGHKYVRGIDYPQPSEHCYRCGMPAGGWTV